MNLGSNTTADRRRGFFEAIAYTMNTQQEMLAQTHDMRAARTGMLLGRFNLRRAMVKTDQMQESV